MRARAWGAWPLCALIVFLAATVCLAGCGNEAKGHGATDEGAYSAAADSSDADKGELDSDMDKGEVLSALQETFGADFSECVGDARGVREGSRYSADLTAREGHEQDIEQKIVGLCGKGVDASTRRRPILSNDLREVFDNAELLKVYSHMRQGTNGAKTVSTIVYTAVVDGKSHVFVFGG